MAVSLPDSFLHHIQSQAGLDMPRFLDAHQQAAPVSVRCHPRKGANHFKEHRSVAWHPFGRYLPERPDFTLDPLFHAGAYYVQEASSMSLLQALETAFGTSRKLHILDACGAPGGKSTLVASWLDGEGVLVANEVIRSRAGILKENLDRWGYANVWVSQNDPRQLGKLEGLFDAIVVDAPCSGSGMFRKDPQAIPHWSEDAVQHCCARQERILEDLWPALKEAGYLIYSTCSYSEAEDEQRVQALVEEGKAEYVPIPALQHIPGICSTPWGYRFYPGSIEGEGFFIALLRKTEAQERIRERGKIQWHKPEPEVAEMLRSASALGLLDTHLGTVGVPEAFADSYPLLLKHLHLIKIGLRCGDWKGKRFVPDHELALSIDLRADIPHIALTREEALRYLKKESLANPYGAEGTVLLCYEGLALGWGNALPNRINNGLPKSWRILKEIPD